MAVNFNQSDYLLINHVWSTKQPYGFCHYARHKGYVSKSFFEGHRCMEKGCRYFEINPHMESAANQSKATQQAEKERKETDKQIQKAFYDGLISFRLYQALQKLAL